MTRRSSVSTASKAGSWKFSRKRRSNSARVSATLGCPFRTRILRRMRNTLACAQDPRNRQEGSDLLFVLVLLVALQLGVGALAARFLIELQRLARRAAAAGAAAALRLADLRSAAAARVRARARVTGARAF